MHSYRFRGVMARAYVMAAFLALLSLLIVAPHAHAAGRHHRHHAHHGRHVRHFRHRRPAAAVRPVAAAASNVLREAQRFVGARNPTHFRGPWCAAFLNMVLTRTGHIHAASMRAIDAMRDGYRVRRPEPGDIAVLAFGHRHHVTFFADWGGRGFYGLGGNQGHRVRLSSYSIARVIAWIRPT